jgi:hypothetical protein
MLGPGVFEIKWIEIRPNDKDQILIGSFYRPPDSDEKAIQELERSLSKIKSDKRYRNAKIFLGGDFNLGGTDLLRSLLILGVIFVDNDNISWSLFPIGGHVVVLVTSVGCDVIMRSNILSFTRIRKNHFQKSKVTKDIEMLKYSWEETSTLVT